MEKELNELKAEFRKLKAHTRHLEQQLKVTKRSTGEGAGSAYNRSRRRSNIGTTLADLAEGSYDGALDEYETSESNSIDKKILEAVFTMARMVESTAIQATRDDMEILETNTDFSYLFDVQSVRNDRSSWLSH